MILLATTNYKFVAFSFCGTHPKLHSLNITDCDSNVKNFFRFLETFLERVTGLEPVTYCLASNCSTTELHPQFFSFNPFNMAFHVTGIVFPCSIHPHRWFFVFQDTVLEFIDSICNQIGFRSTFIRGSIVYLF